MAIFSKNAYFTITRVGNPDFFFFQRSSHLFSIFFFSDQIEDLTPEKYASAFSQMTFSWVDPLMRMGWKKQLHPSDLWTLKTSNRCSEVVPQWYKYFDQERATKGRELSILGKHFKGGRDFL